MTMIWSGNVSFPAAKGALQFISVLIITI